jgi:hypothetical protein
MPHRHRQGFAFCDGSAGTPTFGLQQNDGGPCGVLAAVQAELLRCLLFGATATHGDGTGSTAAGGAAGAAEARAAAGRELPSPSEGEVQVALCEALLTVLARARPSPQSPLVLVTCALRSDDEAPTPCCVESAGPDAGAAAAAAFERREGDDDAASSNRIGSRNQSSGAQPQTPAADFAVQRFAAVDDAARGYAVSVLPQFQAASGVLLFLLSVVLTRGVATVQSDMDDATQPLIGAFGHCSQELLNLLLSGGATSNVFDGSVPMGDSGLTLRGIPRRSAVGYLTHLEALRYCQV